MRNETTANFVLTNDDGWDAPGLVALREAAQQWGSCRVVAPSGPYSGCGHRVTTHEPITVRVGPEGQQIVDGTPADCVRLALHHLVPEVSWILSGINAGGTWEPTSIIQGRSPRFAKGCSMACPGSPSPTTLPGAVPSIGRAPRAGRSTFFASSWRSPGNRGRFGTSTSPTLSPGGRTRRSSFVRSIRRPYRFAIGSWRRAPRIQVTIRRVLAARRATSTSASAAGSRSL
ncbi:5'/3'-nucleotidase SurE [Singulisphaera sp. GP187]|nr:5'/3'-nucleotidase SurE [Singulisphaera sp. GP187]